MSSTNLNPPLAEPSEDQVDQVQYMRLAADYLQRAYSEFRSLASSNSGFADILASRWSDGQTCLCALHDIVDALVRDVRRSAAGRLRDRARALISSLSAKVDELMLYAVDEKTSSLSERTLNGSRIGNVVGDEQLCEHSRLLRIQIQRRNES
jgi:hypothetical protein